MDFILLFSIAVVMWALGAAVCRFTLKQTNTSVRLGYSINLGLAITSIVLYLSSKGTGSSRLIALLAENIHYIALAVIAQRMLENRARFRNYLGGDSSFSKQVVLHFGSDFISALLSIFCVIALGAITTHTLLVPLFPWDAWDFWAQHTKLWFYTGELSYRLNEQYPPFLPLLQYWIVVALKRYDDVLMNIPFCIALIGLASAVYGQVVAIGGSIKVAKLSVLAVITIPMLGTHGALAGYADFFTASSICLASMSVISSSLRKHSGLPWRGEAFTALLFAATIALYKRPGIYWSLLFSLTFLFAYRPTRSAAVMRWVIPAATLTLFILIAYLDKTRGYGLLSLGTNLSLEGSVQSVYDNTVVWGSFGLIWPVFFLILSVALLGLRLHESLKPFVCLTLVIFLLMIVGQLTFRDALEWPTVIGRALLHITPTVVFVISAWITLTVVPAGLQR
jgi:hypothetical protein